MCIENRNRMKRNTQSKKKRKEMKNIEKRRQVESTE